MVDVNAQIDSVARNLGTEVSDGQASRVQTLTQTYRSDIDDVWEAVTTPNRIRRWFLPVSGDLRAGGHYQLEGNAGGEVVECVPPADGPPGSAHFTVTWAFGEGGTTWLTVSLESVAPTGTRLEIRHVGHLTNLPDELWTQFGPSATGIGWDSMLLGLALYLSGAQDGVSPDEAAAWMQSEEGKQFARRSADAWARVHRDDGADPELASAAADATYAMYTGQAPGSADG